jgi:hypothetical protein
VPLLKLLVQVRLEVRLLRILNDRHLRHTGTQNVRTRIGMSLAREHRLFRAKL